VAHSVAHVFEAMEEVRDQLSVDTWLMVGRLQGELERLQAASGGHRAADDHRSAAGPPDDAASDEATTAVLNDLLQGLLALAGLAGESMVRDDGWHFLEAGRRLERALQVVALLGATLTSERGVAAESLVLESVLTAGESIITYRRRYRSRARVATVLELLLADGGNPRSLRFQLDALAASLAVLEGDGATATFDDTGQPARASAHLAMLAASVRALDAEELAAADGRGRRAALEAFVALVRAGLSRTADALEVELFTHPLPVHAVVTPVERPVVPG
jgi:uncharacterized alpha-E superfamily protein